MSRLDAVNAPAPDDAAANTCECCGKCGADVIGETPLCDRCAREIGQRLHASATRRLSRWRRLRRSLARIVFRGSPMLYPGQAAAVRRLGWRDLWLLVIGREGRGR